MGSYPGEVKRETRTYIPSHRFWNNKYRFRRVGTHSEIVQTIRKQNMKTFRDIGISAGFFLVIFVSANSFTLANPVDKNDVEIEHVIAGDNELGEADKRGSFSRILRSGSKEEDAYNRILRGASFSRILRSPTSSFSRILRSKPGSFSRILRSGLGNGGTSSFSRILRSPKSFSRILRSPAQFSRILRSDSDILLDEGARPNRAYTRILRSDPALDAINFDEEDGDDIEKRASSGFSRILRDSFSRIL